MCATTERPHPKPLYTCRMGGKVYYAYEWTGTAYYPCLLCPFVSCANKPADAPKCPSFLNKFHKNLAWKVKT